MEENVTQDRVRLGIIRFGVIWTGQLVSIFGSGLTGFAMGVWVYQQTGSVMQFGLIALFVTLPGTLLSPFAGALVDRWDRRWTMVLSDSVQAVTTVALLILVVTDTLQVWHIYLLNLASSSAGAFQWPAFFASTTLLVPKKHLARASGMVQAGMAITRILSPLVAGAMLGVFELHGILVADLSTYAVAVLMLLMVRIPRPPRSAEGAKAQGSLVKEAVFGWRYIRERPGLFSLLLLFAGLNFAIGMVQVLITPLVLSFATATVLGRVISASGLGMLLGSVTMSVWGGPKRQVRGIFIFLAVASSILLLGGVKPSALLISAAAFGFLFCIPIVMGCTQAIWQRKVEPDLQGRVFAFRRVIASASMPVAYLLGGPLADYVFEPMLATDGLLAGSVGQLIGTGPGRGLGLMILLLGLLNLTQLALAWRNPRLRNVVEEVPDAVGDVPPGEGPIAGGGMPSALP